MPYYRSHLFICTNARKNPARSSCNDDGQAESAIDFLRQIVFEAGLSCKESGVRINAAGCLGRCDQGPALVIYPDAVWYRYQDENDLREIVMEHLQHGHIVTRLLID